MCSAPGQATSHKAGSRSPTAPSVSHSFTANGARPPLPQQAARPPAAPPAQVLCHLLSLTGQPPPHLDHTTGPTKQGARCQHSTSIFSLRGPTPQIQGPTSYSASGPLSSRQQSGLHLATQPGDQRAGGRGPTRPANGPPARASGNKRPQWLRLQTQAALSPRKAPRCNSALISAGRPPAHPPIQTAWRPTPAKVGKVRRDKNHEGTAVRNDRRSGPPRRPPSKLQQLQSNGAAAKAAQAKHQRSEPAALQPAAPRGRPPPPPSSTMPLPPPTTPGAGRAAPIQAHPRCTVTAAERRNVRKGPLPQRSLTECRPSCWLASSTPLW
ncbi:hypothetical protein NDU88_001382 [Pleurodeles waltl]|uniref:Uncharacterized protein n=1 Tax=Pleurodeles waltl TaxID=8319 RepID=A0AAV7TIE3_PLEWA|nr:hypothetical protein NDU88_001382 [Pleurodeles waltl]